MTAVDPSLGSWVTGADGSGFPIQSLPYGVFSTTAASARPGVAIGESILDLRAAAEAGLFEGHLSAAAATFSAGTLNGLIERPPADWAALRARLVEVLQDDANRADVELLLVDRADATLQLPFEVADYVDFYSSLEHATNLGRLFRPDGEPLLPNWRHLPVGYHGRAGTVVVSGTPVRRPTGQQRPESEGESPAFGPSKLLDIELEVGFVTGGPQNTLGEPIAIDDAPSRVFGFVLVNDWSARDIQAWEYQPLGPFLGKSFATSISAWVVPFAAVEPYLVAGPVQDPEPLEYLRSDGAWNIDLELQVRLRTESMVREGATPVTISQTNFGGMYWNMAQQLAHASVNGAVVRPGDLWASGTVSGSAPASQGSFIELTWRGERPITLPGGEQRRFLADGDEVTLEGWCGGGGDPRIEFGPVVGRVLPA
ncbi:MAG: fumarylacetoacetase [Acidimicrobiales bacterium]